jgi:hypothetical protein
MTTTMTKKRQATLQQDLEAIDYNWQDTQSLVQTIWGNFEPNRMGRDNKKLTGIFHFDLPAVKSCLNCESCKDSCYAMKSQRQYKQTRFQRDLNLELAEGHLELLSQLLQAQLDDEKRRAQKRDDKLYIRIHVSGDYPTQDYIAMWHELALCNPTVTFYGYSKVFDILDLEAFNGLPNVNIVNSCPAGYGKNYGPLEEAMAMRKDLNCPICPATLPQNKDKKITCGGTCKLCTTWKNVVFVQH